MSIPTCIKLSGRVYIKYIDDNITPSLGDIFLLLNDDAKSFYIIDHTTCNINGFIKGKIYDGLIWHDMNMSEFCDNKENKLVKKQRVMDSFLLCKEIIKQNESVEVYKKYRGHFTRLKYEPNEYIRGTKYQKKK